jgi:hypothetical protein
MKQAFQLLHACSGAETPVRAATNSEARWPFVPSNPLEPCDGLSKTPPLIRVPGPLCGAGW